MTCTERPLDGVGVAQLIESDGPGGAERVVSDLAVGFHSLGARSVVFLPADGEGWLARQLEGSGVTIEYFRITRPFSPACARSLAAAFRRHDIAVAHSHEFSLAVYGSWASWLAGVHHVITMHGSRYYARRLRRRLAMRSAVALSGRTVAVSDGLADDLSRNLLVPRSRIVMIANGVQYVRPQRARLRDELGLAPDDRLLVAVGNLYPVKGHQHLVDAVGLLTVRHPNVHVAIAGRGDLEGVLAARALDLGLGARLHLLGLRSDVSAILSAADIFVLPSLSEGLPLALLEAMFAGCPIVASDVGEVGRALGYGDAGLLVESANPIELADALDRLLSDPDGAAEMGHRAARRAATEYGLSQMVRRYSGIYEALLERRPRPQRLRPTDGRQRRLA
jgi:glycosyltransferase involved in cell wall biosynthesis